MARQKQRTKPPSKSLSTTGPGSEMKAMEVTSSTGSDAALQKEHPVGVQQTIIMMFKAATMLFILPLISISIQLALQPLYGSKPVLQHYRSVCLGAAVISGFLPTPSKGSRLFPNENVVTGLLGVLLLIAPSSYYWFGIASSRTRSALWGPIVTHLILTAPIFMLSVFLLKHYLMRAISNPPPFVMAAPLLGWNFIQGLEPLYLSQFGFGDPYNSTTIFTCLATLAIFAAVLTPLPRSSVSCSPPQSTEGPNRQRFLTVLIGFVAVGLGIYTSIKPRVFPITSYDKNHTLLASANGKLGLVTVGENKGESYRYLRAGHSLLGGLWIGTKAPPSSEHNPPSLFSPINLGDSVYSAFVLQEGIRFFEAPDELLPEESHNPEGFEKKALIIGLGAGITPRSMNEHGIHVTIVEIDPLVYKYAREYFGLHRLRLPAEGNGLGKDGDVWLQDARAWVNEQTQKATGHKFDYIVHDVFSGGSVPPHIFTIEFWGDLKKLLRDDGVLAVNFAGRIGTPASRSILTTLLHAFPDGTCKAYHDEFDFDLESHADGRGSFLNMVFFCASYRDLKPRNPRVSDYLGSPLRRHVLSTFLKREVPQAAILGNLTENVGVEEDWVLRDQRNRLGEWQSQSAMEHWGVMRQVMPDYVWETY